MKHLMLLCLIAFAVVTLSACSDSGSTTASTTSTTAMQPDTKDMKK